MSQFTKDVFNHLLLDVFKDSEPKDHESLENWSSIEKLLVVGAIYDQCEVLLTHSDIKEISHADQLFQLVLVKLKS